MVEPSRRLGHRGRRRLAGAFPDLGLRRPAASPSSCTNGTAGGWVTGGAVASWVGSTLAGVLLGKSEKTGPHDAPSATVCSNSSHASRRTCSSSGCSSALSILIDPLLPILGTVSENSCLQHVGTHSESNLWRPASPLARRRATAVPGNGRDSPLDSARDGRRLSADGARALLASRHQPVLALQLLSQPAHPLLSRRHARTAPPAATLHRLRPRGRSADAHASPASRAAFISNRNAPITSSTPR